MAWNTGLTGTALSIASAPDTPLRVMAGPGTGKSFAMKRRVARLLEEGTDPRRILAVTFTRTAAQALVDDLAGLGVAGCDHVQARTLHSFCFGLLMRDAVLTSTGRVPRPLLTFNSHGMRRFEAEPLLQDLAATGRYGSKTDCEKRIRAFEADWARLQSEQPGWPTDPIDQLFERDLIHWLRTHSSMLIGEVVPLAYRYVRDNPGASVLTEFDHVLVDEYQDLNRAEQDLIDLLASHGTLSLVGDVDQSIFSFRHANPSAIQDFHIGHAGTHDETLDECRRCPTTVVSMADSLIRHNHSTGTARLAPMPGNSPGEVHVLRWPDPVTECVELANYVTARVTSGDVKPGEVLVLTARKAMGYLVRDKIRDAGIEVHSFYSEEALEPVAAQRAFALVTLLADPEDRVALRWWLGAGSKTWRTGAYARLLKAAEANKLSPRQAVVAIIDGTLSVASSKTLAERYSELSGEIARLGSMSMTALIDDLFPDGQEEFVLLRAAALSVADTATSIQEFHTSLRSAISQPEPPESADYVRVMSLHKSKGLTARMVLVAGAVQGLVPMIKPDLPALERVASIEEQRRLFYVALTRSTETLVISGFEHIPRDVAHQIGMIVPPGTGAAARVQTSEFVAELGPTSPKVRLGADWKAGGYA